MTVMRGNSIVWKYGAFVHNTNLFENVWNSPKATFMLLAVSKTEQVCCNVDVIH